MYRCNASTITTPTVRSSSAAFAFAASHNSSGTRTARTGVPLLGTTQRVVPQGDAATLQLGRAGLARKDALVLDQLLGGGVVDGAGCDLGVGHGPDTSRVYYTLSSIPTDESRVAFQDASPTRPTGADTPQRITAGVDQGCENSERAKCYAPARCYTPLVPRPTGGALVSIAPRPNDTSIQARRTAVA